MRCSKQPVNEKLWQEAELSHNISKRIKLCTYTGAKKELWSEDTQEDLMFEIGCQLEIFFYLSMKINPPVNKEVQLRSTFKRTSSL